MTIKELLDDLEIIRDGLQEVHISYSDDVDRVMTTIEEEGISGDPAYGGGCCTITLNPEGDK